MPENQAGNYDIYVEGETLHIDHMNKVSNGKRLKKGAVIHTAFSSFTIEKQIGSGGNGRVFAAVDDEGSKVAVKFVSANESRVKRKRLKNEVYFCETHSHPNIVKILDRGYAEFEDGDYIFYVMPLYGETLRRKMERGVPHQDAVLIFSGLLSGLIYAHDQGAIHRDIKPENVLFASGSVEPVICDFGIAHFSEENLITAIETKQSDRLANFQYAAPEQRLKGAEIGVTADLYAVGLILNEMFTGQIPQAADYITISKVAPDYGYLDDLFCQLYLQNPLDRLQSAQEVLEKLDLLVAENSDSQSKRMPLAKLT